MNQINQIPKVKKELRNKIKRKFKNKKNKIFDQEKLFNN